MNDKLLPGRTICEEEDFLRGHGTQKLDSKIISSVYGTQRIINKLVSVVPANLFQYSAEIGDVVVGRVCEVLNKKWKVFLNSKNEATLHLSAINIPGIEQRKRIESDEMKMREYFNIADLIVAEVQKISTGRIALHTRNEKYRKLDHGILLQLPPMLIPRLKSYFFESENAEVIVGSNGFVYIGAKQKSHIAFYSTSNICEYFNNCKETMQMISYEDISCLLERY